MIVLKKNFTLDIAQSCEHINFPFEIPSKGNILYVNFRYNPNKFEDKTSSMEMLRNALHRYTPEKSYSEEELLKYLPLRNLLTISLDSPTGVVGTAHKHNNNQKHLISADESSKGFVKQKIIKGKWNITISAHLIVSPFVDVELEVSYE